MSRPMHGLVWAVMLCVGFGCSTVACKGCERARPPAQPYSTGASPVVTALDPPTPAELEAFWGPLAQRAHAAPWYVWWEAEQPVATNFPTQHPFAPATPQEAEVLSAGAWIGAADAGAPLFLEYDVELPEPGRYSLFVRKFWQHGPFRWRFGDAPWQHCSREATLLDSAPLRLHVAANWVSLGEVELAQGKHRLRIELTDTGGAAAFDAFVLSRGAFHPRGKLQPGQSYDAPPEGWVSFDPGPDDFSPTPIDLRALNQPGTGAHGFVRARAGGFVFAATGEPVRFWGVNVGHELLGLPDVALRAYVRRLAKQGVNLVRLYGPLWDRKRMQSLDPVKLRAVHRLASMLAPEGIYLALSIYFPLAMTLGEDAGYAGYQGQHPFALAYFDQRFREMHQGWWRELLTSPNPFGGAPLAKDPTLAIVEFVNEDSTLFWTFKPYEVIPAAQMDRIERQFARWLASEPRDQHAIRAALEASADEGPAPEKLVGLWEITNEPSQRGRDTAEFLARVMREYYASMHHYVQTELGAEALTVCSNWITADERVLGPLDNWANAVCDVMDRHAYVAAPHQGEAASYQLRAGQLYRDLSALRVDSAGSEAAAPALELPLLEARVNGKPQLVSELGWPWPNRFRAEGPLLSAGFGLLHGVDGVAFFADTIPGWSTELDKFTLGDPVSQGQFPAAASIYRRGLLREAPPHRRTTRSLAQLFALQGVDVASRPGLDTLRSEDTNPGPDSPTNLPSLLGPEEQSLGEAAELAPVPTSPGASRAPAVVRAGALASSTGELFWDPAHGLALIAADRVNALVGFVAGAGRVELPFLEVHLHNEYASVTLLALDDRPLSRSKQLLLQLATETTNSGWSVAEPRADGLAEIENPGRAPILMRGVRGSVRVGSDPARVWTVSALDAQGRVERGPRELSADRALPLLPETMYYVLEPREF